jgi:DNA-binding transcriptional LysR family regulator
MLAVMEEGSLGKASHRLHISQPALTKSIQRLEEQLGVRLFERESRGMKPTFYAESLRGYAKAVCVGMAEAQSQIASLRSGTEGILTIAGPPVVTTEFLPQILAQLSRERPRLQVRVVSQNKDLFSDLAEGRFNAVIAMLYDEFIGQEFVKHWIFDDHLVLVMRPDHPLARRKVHRPEDLLSSKWALPDPLTWSHKRLKLYFEQSGFTVPTASIESRDPAVLRSVIATSDHIGVLAHLGVRRDVEAGTLCAFDLNSPLMRRPIGLVMRKSEPMSPAVTSLMRIAEQQSGKSVAAE